MTSKSNGLTSQRGSTPGVAKASAEFISTVPRESGCIRQTSRPPALLLRISYAGVVSMARFFSSKLYCSVYPACRVDSYVDGRLPCPAEPIRPAASCAIWGSDGNATPVDGLAVQG